MPFYCTKHLSNAEHLTFPIITRRGLYFSYYSPSEKFYTYHRITFHFIFTIHIRIPGISSKLSFYSFVLTLISTIHQRKGKHPKVKKDTIIKTMPQKRRKIKNYTNSIVPASDDCILQVYSRAYPTCLCKRFLTAVMAGCSKGLWEWGSPIKIPENASLWLARFCVPPRF